MPEQKQAKNDEELNLTELLRKDISITIPFRYFDSWQVANIKEIDFLEEHGVIDDKLLEELARSYNDRPRTLLGYIFPTDLETIGGLKYESALRSDLALHGLRKVLGLNSTRKPKFFCLKDVLQIQVLSYIEEKYLSEESNVTFYFSDKNKRLLKDMIAAGYIDDRSVGRSLERGIIQRAEHDIDELRNKTLERPNSDWSHFSRDYFTYLSRAKYIIYAMRKDALTEEDMSVLFLEPGLFRWSFGEFH
jgi:hypothetical protein